MKFARNYNLMLKKTTHQFLTEFGGSGTREFESNLMHCSPDNCLGFGLNKGNINTYVRIQI